MPKRYTLALFESANTAVIIKGRVNEEQCIAVDDSDRSRNIGGNRNARRTTFHDTSSIDITSGLKQGLTRCIGTGNTNAFGGASATLTSMENINVCTVNNTKVRVFSFEGDQKYSSSFSVNVTDFPSKKSDGFLQISGRKSVRCSSLWS